jgi:carbonic anhydrase
MEEVARHGFSDAELQRSFSSFCSPTHPLHRGSRVAPDEVLPATKADHESRRHRTPREVILELQRGNGRFWMGLAERPEMNAMERRALIIAQAPSVCILGCSDSRVPVEIVFDQGLGDIFVVRLAGNMLDGSAHGSVEYAVKHLNVKVVMVLGHEGCGAVRGAMSMCEADLQNEPAHLQGLLRRIRAALPLERLNSITDHRARDREAVVANCTTLLQELLQTDVIVERVQDGRLVVCGAFYEITSGIVDFFSLDKHGMVCDVEEAVPPGSPPRSRNPSRAHSQLPAASTGSEDPAPGTPTALPNGRAGATE